MKVIKKALDDVLVNCVESSVGHYFGANFSEV